MKELKYHPIYNDMVICTSLEGFHIFKPAFDEEGSPSVSSDDDKEIKIIREADLDKYFSKMKITEET